MANMALENEVMTDLIQKSSNAEREMRNGLPSRSVRHQQAESLRASELATLH